MSRTCKRDPNQDDFDGLTPLDMDDDEDLLEWMNRPNEARSDTAGKGGRRSGAGRSASRSLPDDWRDFDFGEDFTDPIWR